MHDPVAATCPRDKDGSVTTMLDGKRWAMHDDWQRENCPLHLPMQFVVVEVRGVGSPVKGVVTLGVEDCANAVSLSPKWIAAAIISIARAFMMPPARCLDLP
jgi:hypothetical protein